MTQTAIAWVAHGPAAVVARSGRALAEDAADVNPAPPPELARAAALVRALDAELRRHDSATLALERWCRARGVEAIHARVTARLVRCVDELPTPAVRRRRLEVGPAEPVRHRRVRLCCDGRVLAEADNWYVPSRLTPAMNRLLERTDTPFGRAVQGSGFRRRLLGADLLWAPAATDQGAGDSLEQVPPHVLRHHALLLGADGLPLSEVVETYTREALFLRRPRE